MIMPATQAKGFDWQGKTHPALDVQAATDKLRAAATSSIVQGSRVDVIKFASNSPCEDNYTIEELDIGKEDAKAQFFGVFDGHAGWATSTVLSRSLSSYVAREMKKDAENPDEAVKAAYKRLDDEIMKGGLDALASKKSHAEVYSHLVPAFHGSCALLAVHDPSTSTLYVANAGDSRAVLGRLNRSDSRDDPEYIAHPLSNDHNGYNDSEVTRITSEHPNEPDIIKGGRLLKHGITRAFGNHRWKWPIEQIKACFPRYYVAGPPPGYLTPPYITAEPEVTSTTVQSGDFLILASDGLWDNMSSEDAVSCVAAWLSETRSCRDKGDAELGALTNEHMDAPEYVGEPENQKPAQESWRWTFSKGDMVLEEPNAAAHLVKNGLGGKRREIFCSLVSTQPPECRDARDDITVIVVVFGGI